MTTPKSNTILSGIQPSGSSHIGNYVGAYQNWLRLQEDKDLKCYFMIADYHSISGNYDPKEKRQQVIDLAIDLLAIGLDPKKCSLFVQSEVTEHLELSWVFNTVTPISHLERMTQFKDKSGDQSGNINMGLFSYPVLQAADILMYKSSQVPVGKDQVQHVELTRDIARFFNNKFGETFPEPKPLLTEVPKLRSLTDPLRKMSKSHGDKSVINLSDEPDVIISKLKRAVTESTGTLTMTEKELDARLASHVPGSSEEEELRGVAGVWNLLTILKICGQESVAKEFVDNQPMRYGDLKKAVADALIDHLADFRKRRAEIVKDDVIVNHVLSEGAEAAQEVANTTMAEVRARIGLR